MTSGAWTPSWAWPSGTPGCPSPSPQPPMSSHSQLEQSRYIDNQKNHFRQNIVVHKLCTHPEFYMDSIRLFWKRISPFMKPLDCFPNNLHLGDKCSYTGVDLITTASLFKYMHCITDFSSSDKVFGQLLKCGLLY